MRKEITENKNEKQRLVVQLIKTLSLQGSGVI